MHARALSAGVVRAGPLFAGKWRVSSGGHAGAGNCFNEARWTELPPATGHA